MARPRQNNTILQLLLAISTIFHTQSFVPIPNNVHRTAPSSLLRPPADSQRLNALAMPPAEEEKHKKKRDDNNKDDDWTPTRGGFLPNLGKLRQNVVQQVLTMEDYKTIVVDEQDTMVVVRFFAPWCRACKAVKPLFQQLAKEYSPSVKFVEVPLTKHNAFLHEGLGVPSLPFAHIYHPDVGLVEEMSMNKRTFGEFRHSLETYIDGSCDLPREEEEEGFE